MIKKTLRNSAVGTIVGGALILPMATTVAPQMQLMACQYPNSITTATDARIPDPVVRPWQGVKTDVIVSTEDNKDPNGYLELRVTAPNGRRVVTKGKSVGDGTRTFYFGSPRLGKRDSKTFKVTVVFRGNCRFQDSSGVAFFVVQRR